MVATTLEGQQAPQMEELKAVLDVAAIPAIDAFRESLLERPNGNTYVVRGADARRGRELVEATLAPFFTRTEIFTEDRRMGMRYSQWFNGRLVEGATKISTSARKYDEVAVVALQGEDVLHIRVNAIKFTPATFDSAPVTEREKKEEVLLNIGASQQEIADAIARAQQIAGVKFEERAILEIGSY